MTPTPKHSRLWASLATEPANPHSHPTAFLRDGPGWIREHFRECRKYGMDSCIAQPWGWDKATDGDLYRAGMFRDRECEDVWCEDAGRAAADGIAAGLYMGGVFPGAHLVTLDPANKLTQEFFGDDLRPYITSSLAFLGVDKHADRPEASERMRDTLACMGLGYFEEGVAWFSTARRWDRPCVGTMQDFLANYPALNCPHGKDARIRIEPGHPAAVDTIRKARSQGYGIDVLWNPFSGDIPADVLACVKGEA